MGRPVVVTTGYPRPKGASPLQVPLVPAYRECTAPNSQHGPPLAHPSCNPPAQESSALTVGTIDANGFAANSVASVRFAVLARRPVDAGRRSRRRVPLSATDVRCAATGAGCPGGLGTDYAGQVLVTTTLRITDRDNDVGTGRRIGRRHGQRRAARGTGRLHDHRGDGDRRDVRAHDDARLGHSRRGEGKRPLDLALGRIELRDGAAPFFMRQGFRPSAVARFSYGHESRRWS